MRGKVKYVDRKEILKENSANHWDSNLHARRYTNTYAVLYNNENVDINEDEIRNYYACQNLTKNRIQQLNNDLHNKWIEYYEDKDGDYCLDGCLSDYI